MQPPTGVWTRTPESQTRNRHLDLPYNSPFILKLPPVWTRTEIQTLIRVLRRSGNLYSVLRSIRSGSQLSTQAAAGVPIEHRK